MPGPLRVFISSTMTDLPNERAAVADKMRELNFAPVRAEDLAPNGEGSWTLLEGEILSCDIFVLILGDRYGWVPPSGPHANAGKSVTELEYDVARRAGIPILPFVKRMEYGADAASEDAIQRDRFRKDVQSWSAGHFVNQFALAKDLAESVGSAVIALLTSGWMKSRVPVAAPPTLDRGRLLDLPRALVDAVADRSAVLFAGAGMSLQAGLPSAYAFTDFMVERIREHDPSYRRGAQSSGFNEVATDLSRLTGQAGLGSVVEQLVGLQGAVGSSDIHSAAVEAFDLIVTTNYDSLLERADKSGRLTVLADEVSEPLPSEALVKLHGTFDRPSSLVITAEDLRMHSSRKSRLIDEVGRQIASRSVIVVGSSLRDPSTQELFARRATAPTGWAVAPEFSRVDRLRLREWNLEPLEATGAEFFTALAASLSHD